jgi:hypothetical protein
MFAFRRVLHRVALALNAHALCVRGYAVDMHECPVLAIFFRTAEALDRHLLLRDYGLPATAGLAFADALAVSDVPFPAASTHEGIRYIPSGGRLLWRVRVSGQISEISSLPRL